MANENWCMTGYHSVSVLSDAIAKGLKIDAEEALKAMVSTSTVPWYSGLGEYMKLGYVPLDKTSTAASNTLEYAYDDWTIAAAAQRIGNTEVAERYLKRAGNYRNIFDSFLGLARPRYSDGSFKPEFDIKQTMGQGFIEGNSLNYSFHVPQDVNGLKALMGGDRKFIANLDDLFGSDLPEYCYADNEDITADCLLGGYVHGNEPSHHIPYLYAWTSQPWKTQYWLREIIDRFYRPEIRGLGGNDDCGQMSAWFIFSALGFYPVCPGSGMFDIGSPSVRSAVLHLPDGKTFTIRTVTASGAETSPEDIYIQSMHLNGEPFSGTVLSLSDILAGGELVFTMGPSPKES
jgi:predicted alpha-1,2-mannosidase